MFFVIFATDKSGVHDVREATRAAHRAYLRAPGRDGLTVRMAGPTLDMHGRAMNGSLLIVEASSIAEVEAFHRDDPYVQAGLFETSEIRPWNWTIGNPDAPH